MPQGSFAGRRVLVTGAAGFIGSRVCDALIRSGAEVHAVSRTSQPGLPSNMRWWFRDLADYDAVHQLISSARPDVILHLAGHVFGARKVSMVMPTFRSNLASTVNLLTIASELGCGRLVLTGSLEEPDMTNLAEAPSSPYAAAKWAGTAYAKMFHALFQLPVVVLRVFMVYGPGQRDLNKLIPYTILKLLQGERPQLTSGTRMVDWIYVDDVVNAYLAAAVAPEVEGKTIEVGTGKLVSVREVAESLVQIVNPKLPAIIGGMADRPMEQVRMADVRTAEHVLGWKAQVSLEEGLRLTAEWYAERLREGTLPGFQQVAQATGGARQQ